MRHADRGQEIAELALRHRDNGAVGFDIAGAEDGFLPSRFRRRLHLLAEHYFPATVHAGEAAGLEASSRRSSTAGPCAWATACGSPRTSRSNSKTTKTHDDDDDVDDTIGMVTLGELASWVRDRGIAAGDLPLLQPADRRHRRLRRGHRKPPAGHALPARLQRHHQHRQPADERRDADRRVRAPRGDVRLRPRRPAGADAERSRGRLPAARGEGSPVEYINEAYADLG